MRPRGGSALPLPDVWPRLPFDPGPERVKGSKARNEHISSGCLPIAHLCLMTIAIAGAPGRWPKENEIPALARGPGVSADCSDLPVARDTRVGYSQLRNRIVNPA